MSFVLQIKIFLRKLFPKKELRLLNALRKNKLSSEKFNLTLPDGKVVEGLKPIEAYHEYKDMFINEIYAFHPQNNNPVIIDGGAYIGFSVIWFLTKYPNAKVIAFECDPDILTQFKSNLERNQLNHQVEIVPRALASSEKILEFYKSGDDAGSLFNKTDKKITVETCLLSQYLDQKVDLLKLNIEGAEFEVLEECRTKLKNVSEIIIEFHSFASQEQKLDILLKILKEEGFRYIINHFDYESNLAVKPPFVMNNNSEYILLVYAKNLKNRCL